MEDGYEKYQAYLKSPEWAEVRQLVLERDNYRCRCCGRTEDQTKLTVHHSTYQNLYNEKNHLEDLITLGNECHIAIHRVKSNYCRFSRPKKEQNPETVKKKRDKKIKN